MFALFSLCACEYLHHIKMFLIILSCHKIIYSKKKIVYCPPTSLNSCSIRFWWPPNFISSKRNILLMHPIHTMAQSIKLTKKKILKSKNDGKEFMRFLWVSAPDTIIIVWWIYLPELAIINLFLFQVEIVFYRLFYEFEFNVRVLLTCWNRKKLPM